MRWAENKIRKNTIRSARTPVNCSEVVERMIRTATDTHVVHRNGELLHLSRIHGTTFGAQLTEPPALLKRPSRKSRGSAFMTVTDHEVSITSNTEIRKRNN
jgi:hypothetical protein